jgi:hypothetical protein
MSRLGILEEARRILSLAIRLSGLSTASKSHLLSSGVRLETKAPSFLDVIMLSITAFTFQFA